jgi:hypothetical protein
MNDVELIQGSEEWRQARCGSLGASVIGKALSRLKRSNERAKEGQDVLFELAAERLTGQPAKRTNALQWGLDHEAEARAQYAYLTNERVVEVGLVRHPTIAHAHCSPDALVGLAGGLEVKCPLSATHLRTLCAGEVPEEHLPQVHWNLACTEREWWDFVSFDPRFPPRLQLFVKRVTRDEQAIAAMEEEARAFLAELEALIKPLEAA